MPFAIDFARRQFPVFQAPEIADFLKMPGGLCAAGEAMDPQGRFPCAGGRVSQGKDFAAITLSLWPGLWYKR